MVADSKGDKPVEQIGVGCSQVIGPARKAVEPGEVPLPVMGVVRPMRRPVVHERPHGRPVRWRPPSRSLTRKLARIRIVLVKIAIASIAIAAR
jgi:hypothetical protein